MSWGEFDSRDYAFEVLLGIVLAAMVWQDVLPGWRAEMLWLLLAYTVLCALAHVVRARRMW